VKCTGITAAPLSTADSVRYELWPKEKTPEDWDRLVGALQPDRDVLLFPDRDAVAAGAFPWGVHRAPAPSSSSSASSPDEIERTEGDPFNAFLDVPFVFHRRNIIVSRSTI
jgi:hypothetical protein